MIARVFSLLFSLFLTIDAWALVLKDYLGRQIEITRKVEKVVAIGPGALRLLFYLGAEGQLCGVEEVEKNLDTIGKDYAMTKSFEKVKRLPTIGPGGPGKPPVPELLLNVKPDLIVISSTIAEVYDPNRLQQETTTPVLVISLGPSGHVEEKTLKDTLLLLGKALDKTQRAHELISTFEKLLADLKKRTEGARPILERVYIGAVSFKGAQPFTATQCPYPPLSWLGLSSIADKYSRTAGFLNLDFEVFYKEQPQLIFIDEGNLELVKEDFRKDPAKYCLIEAFQESRVYGLLPFNYYWTNVSTALANAYYVGKVLFPHRFKDIEPTKKANDIFNAFLNEPIYEKFLLRYPGFVNLGDYFKCR